MINSLLVLQNGFLINLAIGIGETLQGLPNIVFAIVCFHADQRASIRMEGGGMMLEFVVEDRCAASKVNPSPAAIFIYFKSDETFPGELPLSDGPE